MNKKGLARLLLIVGIVAAAILTGYATGHGAQTQTILLAIGLMVLGIMILVTVHELGHFLPAKWFKMRAEVFSIGFPPKIFGFQYGETEYQLGATPLGGYVKISGMIDESMDTDHLGSAPQPWEFRSKPVWQRLIVMVGGVTMNVLLGVFIFSMIKYATGEEHLPMSQIKYGIEVYPKTFGAMIGFRTGDQLVSFKGEQFRYFDEYSNPNLLLEEGAYFEVKRNDSVIKLLPPMGILNSFNSDTITPLLFLPAMPAYVQVATNAPAKNAGMKNGDCIIRMDSTRIETFEAMRKYLKGKGGKTLNIAVLRNSDTLTIPVTLSDAGQLGVTKMELSKIFKVETTKYSLGEAFVEGTKSAFGFLATNVKGFKKIANGEASASSSLQGPIEIAAIYADAFIANGWIAFWTLTASLSMVLALVNILPIPALDGGHVVFLLYEAITRREPSTRVRMAAQQVGMLLVLGLMVFVLLKGVVGLF